MSDLRLVGVHEDGLHLLLADREGTRFRLPLDDALRAAARRDRPRLGQLQIEIDGGLRPREVQALIRAGLSAEEVADRAGWTIEKVRKFEGPILAEREYIATQAQGCSIDHRGSAPVTLAARVSRRLKDRGVDREDTQWDSARDDDGQWSVSMTFAAGGRQRTATWAYEPLGGSVTATNDEARWLSEDAVPGLIPTPHVAGSPGAEVYDLESDLASMPKAPRRRAPHEPIDLVAAMREQSARGRRARRRSPAHTPGEEHPREDALPLEELALDPLDAPPPPAARDHHDQAAHLDVHDLRPEPSDDATPHDAADGITELDETGLGDVADVAGDDGPSIEHPNVEEEIDSSGTQDSAEDAEQPSVRPGGRRSVPSWDDIVFGTRTGQGS